MAFYNWKKQPGWLNCLIGLDQFANTIFRMLPWPFTWPGAGNPDKTISYTLGQLEDQFQGKIPWKYPTAKFFAFVCNTVEKDHCKSAYINGT